MRQAKLDTRNRLVSGRECMLLLQCLQAVNLVLDVIRDEDRRFVSDYVRRPLHKVERQANQSARATARAGAVLGLSDTF